VCVLLLTISMDSSKRERSRRRKEETGRRRRGKEEGRSSRPARTPGSGEKLLALNVRANERVLCASVSRETSLTTKKPCETLPALLSG